MAQLLVLLPHSAKEQGSVLTLDAIYVEFAFVSMQGFPTGAVVFSAHIQVLVG